ncbi:MAG: hypothetical protein M0P95_07135 [Sulfuritalea sp.]|nr:hypothetical protein [Sulfuritalea sp.]
MDEGDPLLVDLTRETKKLVTVDPIAGHLMYARVAQLAGNIDKVRHHIDNAKALTGRLEAARAAVPVFGNLGLFSDALAAARIAYHPITGCGWLCADVVVGISNCAFRTFDDFLTQAEEMKIDLSAITEDRKVIARAARVLEAAGVTDDAVARMIDIAGEVMRDHRLIYQGQTPDVDIDDRPGLGNCVYVTYRVRATAAEAADLYAEMVEKITDRINPIPSAFHVSLRAAA